MAILVSCPPSTPLRVTHDPLKLPPRRGVAMAVPALSHLQQIAVGFNALVDRTLERDWALGASETWGTGNKSGHTGHL